MNEWLLTDKEIEEIRSNCAEADDENYVFRAVARAQAQKLAKFLSDQAVFTGGNLFKIKDWQAIRDEIGLVEEPTEPIGGG